MEELEKLKQKLYKSIEQNGINAEETLKISKEIDILLNKLNKK